MTTTPRTTRTRKLKKGQFILLQVELSDKAQFNNRAWVYRELRNRGYKWDTGLQRWAKDEVTP
jgi:tRNA splicing endonuclease